MTSQLNVDTIANKAGSGTVAFTKQSSQTNSREIGERASLSNAISRINRCKPTSD